MVPALKSSVYDEAAYSVPHRTPFRRGRRPSPSPPAPVSPSTRWSPPTTEAHESVQSSARRRTVSPLVALPVVGLLLLSVGMGLVAQRVQVMTMGYALVEAKQELERAKQEHARLTVEVARSRSLERIETLARTRLGMVDAAPTNAIVMAAGLPTAVAGAGPGDGPETPSPKPSPLAAFGEWLHARFATVVEAGGR